MVAGIRIGFVPLAGCCATASGAGACAPAGADLTETGVSRLAAAAGSGVSAAPVGVSSCANPAIMVDDAVGTAAIAPTVARGGLTVGSPIETWVVGAAVGTAAVDAAVGRLSVAA